MNDGPRDPAIAERPRPTDGPGTGSAVDAHAPDGFRRRSVVRRSLQALSFGNASALYVFAALFVLFSVWVPETFLTDTTWRTLLDEQALTAMVAVALVLPLCAGAFDLSVGAAVGLGAIVSAWLLAKVGTSVPIAIVLTLAAGALMGLTNGLLVTKAHIPSFIATLGVSSVIAAMVLWLSESQQILNLGPSFQEIATQQFLGITYPVYYLLIVGLVVWYVLERTPAGRRVYATGGNPDAARLSGVRIDKIVVITLLLSGMIATSAGLLLSSRLGTGDPTVGPSFLLPAFAAAFLGSTQFHPGRFNVWGTIVAVYVLATGVKGLQLGGAPVWIPDLFNGVALLLAVGLSKHKREESALR